MNFREWFKSSGFFLEMQGVAFNAARKVRRGLGKTYKPGTFGIEIEFYAAAQDPEGHNRPQIDYDELKNRILGHPDFHSDFERMKSWTKPGNPFYGEKPEQHLDRTMYTGDPEWWTTHYNIPTPYLPPSKFVPGKIEHYIQLIQAAGGKAQEGDATADTWGVGRDGLGVVEVRTPILTTRDIPFLKKVLEELKKEKVDGESSAHVHIGMPDDTDGFDLLAITTLVDEDAVEKDAGREPGEFEDWAQFRPNLHQAIANEFKAGVYTSSQIMDALRKLQDEKESIGKYAGTNVLPFFKQGTVEFRYLTAQILQDMNKFLAWLNYYLMLPRIARSKKQVRLDLTDSNLIFTRLPHGKVRVNKNPMLARQMPEPPAELRGPLSPHPDHLEPGTRWDERLYNLLVRKYGNSNVLELEKATGPIEIPSLYKRPPLREIWNKLPEPVKKEIAERLVAHSMLPKPPVTDRVRV